MTACVSLHSLFSSFYIILWGVCPTQPCGFVVGIFFFFDEFRFQRSVWIFIPVHEFISFLIFFLHSDGCGLSTSVLRVTTASHLVKMFNQQHWSIFMTWTLLSVSYPVGYLVI